MTNLVKYPVFPNWFPYNDMAFDGFLKVGEYAAVKTRNWNWDYRGPVLFYTSGRTATEVRKAYGYQDDRSRHQIIIGVGDLVEVRNLTSQEAMKMVLNFNNIPAHTLELMLAEKNYTSHDSAFWVNNLGLVAPLRKGLFFQNMKRFQKSMPFSWPAGPIRPIFINPRKVAGLSEQLKLVGY